MSTRIHVSYRNLFDSLHSHPLLHCVLLVNAYMIVLRSLLQLPNMDVAIQVRVVSDLVDISGSRLLRKIVNLSSRVVGDIDSLVRLLKVVPDPLLDVVTPLGRLEVVDEVLDVECDVELAIVASEGTVSSELEDMAWVVEERLVRGPVCHDRVSEWDDLLMRQTAAAGES